MLILSATTDAIEVVLATAHATNPLQCVASWRDMDTSTFAPDRTVIDTNGATAVDAVTGPASSTQRIVSDLSVFNNDTIIHQVTVKFDANGTEYILFRAAIGPREEIRYTSSMGWHKGQPEGPAKEVEWGTPQITVGTVGVDWTMLIMAADAPANGSSTANLIMPLRELVVPVLTNQRYFFKYTIFYTSAAAGTGARFPFLVVPPNSQFLFRSYTPSSATAHTTVEGTNVFNLPTAATGASASTGSNMCTLEGLILPVIDGQLTLGYASEIASSAITPQAGSYVEYIAV